MKKLLLIVFMSLAVTAVTFAENTYRPQEPREHLYHDMLMTMLGPDIGKAVDDYYSRLLTESPGVYPYQIDVVKAERMGENGTFHFLIILEVTPVVGPHISVGKDRLTFEIAPGITPWQVKLIKFEHLETHKLPEHWQNIIRRP